MMTVSQDGQAFRVVNWSGVLQQPRRYTFHPQFVHEESAAFRAISKEVADAYVGVLASMEIDAEVVETE